MDNGFEPKILSCVDCGQDFVFSINAQVHFAERGYTEEPKRCKICYMKAKGKQTTTPEDTDYQLF